MRLPGWTVKSAELVDSSNPAAGKALEAGGQAFGALSQGMYAYGQELVKTQLQKASVQLSEQLDNLAQNINSKKSLTAQELRDAVGGEENLPPEMRQFLTVKENGQDVDNPSIPTWVVAGQIYDAQAKKALEASSSEMTVGEGWRNEFASRAQQMLHERKVQLADKQMREMDGYLQTQQLNDFSTMLNSAVTPSDFSTVRQAIAQSNVLAPEVKEKLRDKSYETEALRPVWDALRSDDIMDLTKARVRVDDDKIMASVEPQHRAEYAHQLDARIDAWKKEHDPKKLKDDAMKIADENARNSVYTAWRGGVRSKSALLKLVPPPGAISGQMQEHLMGWIDAQTKPEPTKTNWAVYQALTQAMTQDPDGFKNDRFRVGEGKDGKPVYASLLQYAGKLGESELHELIDKQSAMRADKTGNIFSGIEDNMKTIDAELVDWKFDPYAKDAKSDVSVGFLRKVGLNAIANAEQQKGGKLTPQERSAVVRTAVQQNVRLVKPWMGLGSDSYEVVHPDIDPDIAAAVRATAQDDLDAIDRVTGMPSGFELSRRAGSIKSIEPQVAEFWQKWGITTPLTAVRVAEIYGFMENNLKDIDAMLGFDPTGKDPEKLNGNPGHDTILRVRAATYNVLHGVH